MVWCSGWRLASACSEKGILGVIGSGSMYPEVLEMHIKRFQKNCSRPFGVNLPLLYPDIDAHIDTIIKYRVPVVITSAGSPAKHTGKLKENGIKVLHVVSSAKFAQKSEAAGVDAVICEGFEAGGHNGREETTSFCLIPEVREAVDIPVVAAGGIASGKAVLAAMALGADGVQIGTRFAAARESSAHDAYKNRVIGAEEGDTILTLKELAPVRMIKNGFYQEVIGAYRECADTDTLLKLLGRGRAKRGIFEGNLEEGELEIGQAATQVKRIQTAAEIIDEILNDFRDTGIKLGKVKFDV